MGKVRFYNPEQDRYVTLRVEQDGIYLEDLKLSFRKVKTTMPPKKQERTVSRETSAQHFARISDPDILEKLLAIFDDFEQTIELDPKSMVTLKPAFKKSGCQLGVCYVGTWNNYSGQSVLESLLAYYTEVLEA